MLDGELFKNVGPHVLILRFFSTLRHLIDDPLKTRETPKLDHL